MSEGLRPDVALGVKLSAIMGRNQFTADPRPVIDELLEVAGPHADDLAQEAGLWAGYHHDSAASAPLVSALEGIPGARHWFALGRKRAGGTHRTIDPPTLDP